MVKVAVWCRHKEDNVIGIGAQIPWHVKSDFQRFRRLTEGQYVVAGQTTYESFPNRTLPNRKIVVLTFDPDYVVADQENHQVCYDVSTLSKFEHDLYVAGGASVYKLFMSKEHLKPEIVVDCEYAGEMNSELSGEKVNISASVEALHRFYDKIYGDYWLDDINTTIWQKKGSVVDEALVNKLIKAIEFDKMEKM